MSTHFSLGTSHAILEKERTHDLIEIISSPTSKSPSTLRSGDTIENQANFHRQIMLDLVSESNRNLFQSEAGRSLGISLSPQGFSGSDRTYADRVLVDRLIKEALMKRRVVYGIFFDDAMWCLLPNVTNNSKILILNVFVMR